MYIYCPFIASVPNLPFFALLCEAGAGPQRYFCPLEQCELLSIEGTIGPLPGQNQAAASLSGSWVLLSIHENSCQQLARGPLVLILPQVSWLTSLSLLRNQLQPAPSVKCRHHCRAACSIGLKLNLWRPLPSKVLSLFPWALDIPAAFCIC